MGKTPARLRLRDFLRRKIARQGAEATYSKLVDEGVVANSKLGRLKGESGENTTLKTLDNLAKFFGVEPWELLHPDSETASEITRLSAAALQTARKVNDLPTEELQEQAYALLLQAIDFQNAARQQRGGQQAADASSAHDTSKPKTPRPVPR